MAVASVVFGGMGVAPGDGWNWLMSMSIY
jgi:hypothetical protein